MKIVGSVIAGALCALLLGAACFVLHAQTASVTILTLADAKEAAETYRAMKDAAKRWEALQVKLKRNYGIERDVEFSSDFKAIVQKYAAGGTVRVLGDDTMTWSDLLQGQDRLIYSDNQLATPIPCSKDDHRPMANRTDCGPLVWDMDTEGWSIGGLGFSGTYPSDHPPHNYQDPGNPSRRIPLPPVQPPIAAR